MSVLSLENVCFSYGRTKVLNNISYEFDTGKVYCIMGKSGAGKTTLLSVLSGLAQISEGKIICDGENIETIDKYKYRSKYIGVIFQSYNLISKFTALENVILSMDIAGVKGTDKKKKAYDLLKSVGLTEDEANRRILKLSGGQQQRVAIARALSYDAKIILADEPTGNLDGETQDEIMEIFRNLAAEGKCVILVSHSKEVAKKCNVIYPEAQLVLCSVTPRFKTESGKRIEQTDLKSYVTAGEALAEKLNIHFINLYDIGITVKTEYGAKESGYLSDGLHPTAKGCSLISEAVSDGLVDIENSLPVSLAGKNVVFLGDSIFASAGEAATNVHKVFGTLTGANVYNFAVSDSTVKPGYAS